MHSIYLIHSIYNNYDDTINYIFLYYNYITYSMLLMITNNKKIIKYNNCKSGKNILLLKHRVFF